jgi:hypothetical protein
LRAVLGDGADLKSSNDGDDVLEKLRSRSSKTMVKVKCSLMKNNNYLWYY